MIEFTDDDIELVKQAAERLRGREYGNDLARDLSRLATRMQASFDAAENGG